MRHIFSLCAVSALLNAEVLPTVTISADPKGESAQNIATSVEVIDSDTIRSKNANHFSDLITQSGNVNFSGESSRAKFIQIRGIGERSQYTRTPDTSVGFMIDGIDFSGVGAAADLFDIKQIEILKGPQSTRFGASALAGLVNIESNDPEMARNSHAKVSVASYNQKSFGIATTGAFTQSALSPQYRFAVSKHNSDGFYHNKTLHKRDTNNLDELTARAKLRFFVGDDWQLDLTAMHIDLDNGYDKWAPKSGFSVYSNAPGKDKQKSSAGAFKLGYEKEFKLSVQTTYAKHDLFNSFDGDWVTDNDLYQSERDRTNTTSEVRIGSIEPIFAGSTDWVFGLYRSSLLENSQIDESWWGSQSVTKTDYRVDKNAIFGQFDFHTTPKTTIVTALRAENIDNSFIHSAETDRFSSKDTLWGGQLALRYKPNEEDLIYGSVTKGYKAGGYNAGVNITDRSKLKYKSESAINYELGYKHHSNAVQFSSALFYIDRVDAQLTGSEQKAGSSEFRFYTINSSGAYNYGLESDLLVKATESLDLIANLALIKTSFKRAASELATIEPKTREQAHAPRYQYFVAAEQKFGRFFARIEGQGMDKFYFSNSSHDQKSKSYNIGNASVGYDKGSWDLSLWCKNFTDERYATRGFFFDRYDGSGNKLYTALGDPRVVGATVRAKF